MVATAQEAGVSMTLSAVDRLDILDILARADPAASRRDADAYLAYFTDDAVLDGAVGEHKGKTQLRQSVGPIWQAEGATSVHLTMNAVIDPVDDQPARAVATSRLLILEDASPVSIRNVSTIVQHLVKVGTDWRIERRTVGPITTSD
jgi:ketosteroid isomerase-like protein